MGIVKAIAKANPKVFVPSVSAAAALVVGRAFAQLGLEEMVKLDVRDVLDTQQ